MGQAQPAGDAGGQVLVGRRVEREPPRGLAPGRRADETNPLGHLRSEHAARRKDFIGRRHMPMVSPARIGADGQIAGS